MYIILDNKKEYTNDFLNYVIRMMFMVGLSQLNNIKEKLPAIDQYLGKIYNSRRTFFSYQIIISGLKNIIFKRTDKDIVLKIDDITKVPYLPNVTLVSVCKLIDEGNIEIEPTHIFRDVFSYVKENIDNIYERYDLGIPI